MPDTAAEHIARAFHEAYERLAPEFGYATRAESAVPWASVPESNRRLMVATVEALLASGVIRLGRDRASPVISVAVSGPEPRGSAMAPRIVDEVRHAIRRRGGPDIARWLR